MIHTKAFKWIPDSVNSIDVFALGYFDVGYSEDIQATVDEIWDNNLWDWSYQYQHEDYWEKSESTNFIIKGKRGTDAEEYAKENDFKFVPVK